MERNQNCQIISSGKIRDGYERDSVYAALRQRLRFNDATINKLLNGQEKVVKKELDDVTANKYKNNLLSIGVEVRIQRTPLIAKSLVSNKLALVETPDEMQKKDSETPSSNTLPQGQMQCPKCNHIQLIASDCVSCGVIVERFDPTAIEHHAHKREHDVSNTVSPFNLRYIGLGIAALITVTIFYSLYTKQPNATPQALAQIEAIRKSHEHKRPAISDLRKLIHDGKFHTAEQVIIQLHDLTVSDISWEDTYFDTFNELTGKKGIALDALNRWVDTTGSAIAYLTRGVHYAAAAQNARGDKFASQTTDAQFAAQSKLAKIAVVDLKRALQLNNELIPAHAWLIWLTTARGVNSNKRQILQDAITSIPGTFHVRYTYMNTILPKWGGSYDAIEQFANESVAYLANNPRLWLLNGITHEQKGHSAQLKNDCDQVIKHLTRALEYGIDPDWLNSRAFCLAQSDDFELAMKDIDQNLKYYPNNAYALELKSWLNEQM